MAELVVERHAKVAEEDLPAIFGYIAKDNPDAAERFLEAVETTCRQIGSQPESGVSYRSRHQKLRGIRMLPVSDFSSYLIFYRVESLRICVLHVVHGARDLPRLFRREQRS